MLVFYKLNSAIERGTKPDALGCKSSSWEIWCCASKPGKPVLELCLAHLPNRGDARWKLSDNGAIKNLVQIGVK
jgi:hypothetical protein